MTRRRVTDGGDLAIGLLIAFSLIMAAVGALGEGCDWLDRRSCRIDGGTVQELDRGEWRCARGTP